jgi:hypothetical protein
LREGGSSAEQPATLKMSRHAHFQGGWWGRTTTNIKNKHVCSFSILVVGGDSAEQLATLKTSRCAHF